MLKDVLHPSLGRTHSLGVRTGAVLLGITLVIVALSGLTRLARPAAIESRSGANPPIRTASATSELDVVNFLGSNDLSVSNLSLSPGGLLVADFSARKSLRLPGNPATNNPPLRPARRLQPASRTSRLDLPGSNR